MATEAALGQPLSVVMVVRDAIDSELRALHREFHLGAGVDAVVETEADASADWVIESKEHEFWWPRGGSLRDVLDGVPSRFGSVRAPVRDLVAVQGDEAFAERAVYRLAPGASIPNYGSQARPVWRLVQRTSGDGPTLRGWYPVEVLRLPFHDDAAYEQDRLAEGLAAGFLRRDLRLRDALRALAAGQPFGFGPPDVLDDAELAFDVAGASDDDVIRLQVRLDELERRLSAVESTPLEALKRKLRAIVSSGPGRR